MRGRIFLGKPYHWAILVALVVALYFTGGEKLHVIHFNRFILILLAVAAAIVAIVLRGTKADEQVTRDPIKFSDTEDTLAGD